MDAMDAMDATSHPDAGPRLPETSAPGGDAALHEEALAVLRRLVDRPDARFKDGQFEAIEALVAHRRRALVVQRTAGASPPCTSWPLSCCVPAARGPR